MRKRLSLLFIKVFLGLFAALFSGCADKAEIRHVVLISIDTLRADYLSSYGFPQSTTPNIDAVANHGTLFRSVVTPVPITLPAHASMLTGKIPPSHGVHHNFGYQLADSNQTLSEMLQKQGFRTDGIISSFVLHSQFGMNQGFDSYNDEFSEKHLGDHGLERKAAETTDLALSWLDRNKGQKSFLFLHYYDPHWDYAPPEPFSSTYSDDLYAGEIAYTDHCIGQVIDRLKELNMYDSTLLIIVGDHGEMLGEHGEKTHTYFIYESAIKVPLVIKLPGQKKGGSVSEPVGIIDIVPTVCSLMGINIPAEVQGADLTRFLEGDVPKGYTRNLYSESVAPTQFGASSLMSVTGERWKYIQAPRPELYDIVADPGELNNLVMEEPHRARILKDELMQIIESSVRKDPDSRMELDAESIRRLESLGYVAGKEDGEIEFDDSKGDPKDFVHLLEVMRHVKHLIEDRNYNEARTLLEKAAVTAPQCARIFSRLGEVCMLQADYDGAVIGYRKAYQLDPQSISDATYNNLAWIQATQPSLSSRDVQEALRYAAIINRKTRFEDPRALDTLSVTFAASGLFEDAVEAAEKACRLAKAMNDALLAQEIAERIRLFKENKPYIIE